MLMEFEEGGGVFEIAALTLSAVRLNVAKGGKAFLELAGETLALDAEVGEEAMGIDDVEGDGGRFAGRVGGAIEHVGFEQRDTVETPGGIDELLDELRFGGSGGLVFVEEAAAMVFVDSRILRGKDRGSGGQAVAQGVERRALLAGFGAGTGGVWELARLMSARRAYQRRTGSCPAGVGVGWAAAIGSHLATEIARGPGGGRRRFGEVIDMRARSGGANRVTGFGGKSADGGPWR